MRRRPYHARPRRHAFSIAPAAVLTLLAGCAAGPAPSPAPTGDPAIARERAAGGVAAERTLGIPPFAVDGTDASLRPLAYALADLLTTDLARAGGVRLVERARFSEVLRELDLSETGRVDPASAPRVGRLVQARTLVLGGVGGSTETGGTLRLAVRLADVGTGTVEEAVDASAPVADILAAEKALAFRVLEALGVTLTPAERAAIERRPTQDLAALLAYGRGVEQEYLGNFRRAADEFRRAQRIDGSFRAAGERAVEVRAIGESGTATPLLVPGVRSIDAVVSNGIDGINRPLVPVSRPPRVSGQPTDPSFPATTARIIITVVRP